MNSYIEGFTFTDRPQKSKVIGYKPIPTDAFVGKTLKLIFDHANDMILTFDDKTLITIDHKEQYQYQMMPLDDDIYFLTIHCLRETPQRNITIVIDDHTKLVTRLNSIITEIEKGSTRLVEGTNLVVREVDFGYIEGDKIPSIRHHYTDDLTDHGFSYIDSPESTIYYHIHSPHKITYYQKKFPPFGNPIDKDGVGYGELLCIKINETTYLFAFIKHSHGNQPTLVWNKKNKRVAANFFGISRQTGNSFLVTGGGYMEPLY